MVSIVMNIRNGAPYLREAIDSVLTQTHADWELIAWDDWSTDDSASIVKQYQDSRIRYIFAPEDTPLGRARCLASRQAKGDWIAFLDQDDVWTNRKLELQLAAAGDDPRIGLVYGRTIRFGESIEVQDFDHRHEYSLLPEGNIFDALFIDSCFLAMSSAMFRRSALEMAGEVPANVRMSPDYFYYLEVCSRFEARAVEEVVCRYRVHGNNMTRPSWVQMHEECLWLVERWAHRIDPGLAETRRRVHQTLIAVNESQNVSPSVGLARLLRFGSIPYLLSRPVAIGFRSLRRKIQKPQWRRRTEQLGCEANPHKASNSWT